MNLRPKETAGAPASTANAIILDRGADRMPGVAPRLRLADGPLDAHSQERIAAAALLLRSICPNDGDVEILLHEMARTLERIVGVDDACCRTAQISPAQRHAWAAARG